MTYVKPPSWAKHLARGSRLGALSVLRSFTLLAGYALIAGSDIEHVASFERALKDDQKSYLEAGAATWAEHELMWRAPLYSAWMAPIYALSGKSLEQTFYLEKTASIALFSLALAGLAAPTLGWGPGAFVGAWFANSKYLAIETNGSHLLAASLLAGSIAAIYCARRGFRLVLALVLAFFASQSRQEAWLSFALALTCALCVLHSRFGTPERAALRERRSRPLAVLLTSLAVSWLVGARLGSTAAEPGRLSVAFGQNFAVGYFQRNGLQGRFQKPWSQWEQLWREALPGISPHDPWGALVAYPREIKAHLADNILSIPLPLTATLSMQRRNWLGLLVGMGFAISLLVVRQPPPPVPRETFNWAVVMVVGQASLVVMLVVLNAYVRYIITLIPLAVFLAMTIVQVGARRWIWGQPLTGAGARARLEPVPKNNRSE